jgi:hypothetical protein
VLSAIVAGTAIIANITTTIHALRRGSGERREKASFMS